MSHPIGGECEFCHRPANRQIMLLRERLPVRSGPGWDDPMPTTVTTSTHRCCEYEDCARAIRAKYAAEDALKPVEG